MGVFFKLLFSLSMLMTLTSTWARLSSESQREIVIKDEKKHDENATKKYIKNEDDNEIILTESNDPDNWKYYENHAKRYLKIAAEKLLRKNVRNGGKRRRSLHDNDEKIAIPFSARRLEKMLEKALLKIITGDLSTADMLFLKSLNYSLEEVLAIRERELDKMKNSPDISDVEVRNKKFYHQKMKNDLIKNEESLTESSMENNLKNNEKKSTIMMKKNQGSLTESSMENNLKNNEEKSTIMMKKNQGSLTESSMENNLKNNEEKSTMMMKKKKSVTPISTGSSSEIKMVERLEKDVDFDAYNRQAVYDYENGPNVNKMSQESQLDPISSSVDYENRSDDNVNVDDEEDDLHANFDRAMEPHVVFKIRYDDSEFDSGSSEKGKKLSRERIDGVIVKILNPHDDENKKKITTENLMVLSANELSESGGINTTPGNNENKPFQASTIDVFSSLPVVYRLGNFLTSQENLEMKKAEEDVMEKDIIIEEKNASLESTEINKTSESEKMGRENFLDDSLMRNKSGDESRKNSLYEGLEWVEDDVYRVIPEAVESLNYYDDNENEMNDEIMENIEINETSTREIDRKIDEIDHNDTNDYQNENPQDESHYQSAGGNNSSMRNSPNVSLSTYQQLALAHRRDSNVTSPFDSQGQKAIEDIKLKILAMTGRFNLSSSSNQVQRERLTMFSPICQEPRNTDTEAWSDPFLMNMHFQLNLTSGDHVVAAKLRIYKLPQDNMTVTSGGAAEEEDEEEKKIRISIYFYTKSLKKHRSKKRLMDSVVIALTTEGSHLALDVRQALRFWRQNLRNSHSTNNHGLVIQVEDQEGRPLKPSQYVQQDLCHTSELNEDDKAYQRVPAIFIQACSRYVRVVNGEVVTYVNCSKSSRNGRH